MTGTVHKTRRNKYHFVRLVVLSHRTFKKPVRPEGRATQGGMMDMALAASAAPISGRPKRRLSSRNTNASCYGATVANGAYATVANILRELLELERMIPTATFSGNAARFINHMDRVHETLDDNRRVVLEVKTDSRVVSTERLQPSEFGDCAKFVKPVAEDFIVKTEFIDEADNDKEALSTFRTSCPCFLNFQDSIIFKAKHLTTDEKPDAHSAEEQGPPSDVGMQRTNKRNKKIQTRTALKERRYSAQSKRSSPKYHPTGQKATREERKRLTSNHPIKVSCCIGVELVDVPSADFTI
ncbi:hypothetical protein R1sor_024505 [Riccia sorocarpa]|uniref:Uncharacterized protein n=1 Tax=Riccia sorocarpa TaxID=122646 RepID=A0ABD3GUQ2_9MARC